MFKYYKISNKISNKIKNVSSVYMIEFLGQQINTLYKNFNFIFMIQFVLVILGILAILYVISINMDVNDRWITKEGFASSSTLFPDAHRSLLLDSIYERDRSRVFKTFKNQITGLSTSTIKSYDQKSNNDKENAHPCGGKDTNPNMCLYSKVKKKQKEKKYAKNCIKLTSPKRVGWFITS